jgi:hypothetical protein
LKLPKQPLTLRYCLNINPKRKHPNANWLTIYQMMCPYWVLAHDPKKKGSQVDKKTSKSHFRYSNVDNKESQEFVHDSSS